MKGSIATTKTGTIRLLVFSLCGLALNVLLSKLVTCLGLPLFLDNVGTILVAALCGALPGMTVGFLTNLFNSLTDPISMYYGILSIAIAYLTSVFSRRRWFRSWGKSVLAAICFALIGGGIGSCMTWILYGGGIGTGISAAYVKALLPLGLPLFWTQFIADLRIDLADKLLTVLVAVLLLRRYSRRWYGWFPFSYLYDRSEPEILAYQATQHRYYKKRSVNNKVLTMILVSLISISAVSTLVGVILDTNAQLQQHIQSAKNSSRMAASMVNGDQVNDYLSGKIQGTAYTKTMDRLERVYHSFDDLKYLYIYQIQADGCHVVFDMDTPELQGDERGSVVAFDPDFSAYEADLLAGKEIPPVVSNGQYGALITAYWPIKDHNGTVVAYAGTDIAVDHLIRSTLTYTIQMIAIQFSLSVLIVCYSLWFAHRRLVEPITNVVQLSHAFDQTDAEEWLHCDAWTHRPVIETGDEIEELYHTVCSVQENVTHTVIHMRETERKLRHSEALEEKNRALARAMQRADEANAAKTDFLSRMSHDMRTPLNAVLGFAAVARDEPDLSPIVADSLEKITSSGKYLLGLINDVLDMSKIESGKIEFHNETVDGPKFLTDIAEVYRAEAIGKGISLVTDFTRAQTRWIVMDSLRSRQVYSNLLSNAIKFSEAGTQIHWTVADTLLENGQLERVAIISDQGYGMSPAFLKKMYQPFVQEQNARSNLVTGTGLGLSIVKNLVDLSGGTIQAESELGKGTTFTITLRRTIGMPPEHTAVQSESVSLAWLHGRRVLLCEDHPLNAQITVKLLEKQQMHVDVAENGQRGIELLCASKIDTYDAILMDIRMPVMDGLEATKRIRSLNRSDCQRLPIIAMTANAFTEDIQQTVAAGMTAHLTKPAAPQLLYETLAACIRDTQPSTP